MAKLSIIVPAYNESDTIEVVLDRLLKAETGTEEREIIVVDDCSRDDTAAKVRAFIAEHPAAPIKAHFAEVNRGKGAAFRKGVELATGDFILIQDADLEYNPRDIPVLVAPILANEADVVYGSRFLGGPHRVLYFWHYVGNTALTLLSNMLTNLNLTDMETGYKVFRTEVLRKLDLKQDRFGIEPELTAKVAKARARVYEVQISYCGRTYEEGKKITWRDGVAAVMHIIRHNLFE
jgi:glycosyltransferase involved in cell wall biosynthesis